MEARLEISQAQLSSCFTHVVILPRLCGGGKASDRLFHQENKNHDTAGELLKALLKAIGKTESIWYDRQKGITET